MRVGFWSWLLGGGERRKVIPSRGVGFEFLGVFCCVGSFCLFLWGWSGVNMRILKSGCESKHVGSSPERRRFPFCRGQGSERVSSFSVVLLISLTRV